MKESKRSLMLTMQDCAVLFDLDGVIVDTKEEHFESFAQLGVEAGYTISEEQFCHVFGWRNDEIFPFLYGESLPEERIRWLADRKEAIFRDLVRDHITALPGVPELIPALHTAGFQLSIGTSTPRDNVDLILAALKLRPYFAAIVTGDDVQKGKPDPEVFLRGAEQLHIPPQQCVVVEDAVAGVQAAINGGMQSLAVTTNHPRQSLCKASRVVDSLAEVSPADIFALLQI